MNDQSPARSSNSRSGVLIAVGLAVAVAAGVFVQRQLARPDAGAADPAATATTQASAEPMGAGQQGADATAAVTEPTVPEVLPRFELKDRDGKIRTLADWKGQPLVVNYWATWCPPCVREIPLLSQLRRDHQAQKLEVIGIAVDFRDDVLKFADERKLDYPLLIGEEDGLAAVAAVGMTAAFPFTLFADSQQRIVALKVGELHEEEAALILDRVFAVDAGRLDLVTARSEISAGLKDLATKRGIAEAAAAAGKTADKS
jgi:peroxiredoxin